MELLRKWRRMSPSDRQLLLKAFWWVSLIRLGLWTIRCRRLTSWLERTMRHKATPSDPARIAWAVSAISRKIPAATCLVQALAGRRLLAESGHAAILRLGVKKGSQGKLLAHAWLEHAGRIILGELPELHEFCSLQTRTG